MYQDGILVKRHLVQCRLNYNGNINGCQRKSEMLRAENIIVFALKQHANQ
jgi:hypothetical protein